MQLHYASDGELQFTLPGVLKLPPISHHGNLNEIIDKFGSTPQPTQRPRQKYKEQIEAIAA